MGRGALFHLVRSQARNHLTSKNLLRSGYDPCRFGTWLQTANANTKPSINSATKLAFVPERWASSRSTTEEDKNKISIGARKGSEIEETKKDSEVVYYGPISEIIKYAKGASLLICSYTVAVAFGYVETVMTSQDTIAFKYAAAVSTLIFLNAAPYWFVRPYIHKLRWQPGSDTFEVEMLSWLAPLPRTIKFSDIRLPETKRPFVTFKANGNFYFVDAEHCHNKALLARLTPTKGYDPCRFGTWLRTANANTKPSIDSAAKLAFVPERWASSRSTTEEDKNKISIGPHKGSEIEETKKDSEVVYYGPISEIIKFAKGVSLLICFYTVGVEYVATVMESQVTIAFKSVAAVSTAIFLSAELHWFVSPYIHKLRWQPGSDTFEVEMLSWLAPHIPRTIKFSDIRLPKTKRPFVTFKANGKFYFVDAEHCHNKALLARLTPTKGSQESPFKNL